MGGIGNAIGGVVGGILGSGSDPYASVAAAQEAELKKLKAEQDKAAKKLEAERIAAARSRTGSGSIFVDDSSNSGTLG